MKKITLIATLVFVSLLLNSFTSNPTGISFEGVVSYSVTFDGTTSAPVHQVVQGSSLTTYIKGSMTRTESVVGGTNTIAIYNGTGNTPIILIKSMGGNYQLIPDSSTSTLAVPISYLGGTKTIATYSCNEAQATMMDGSGNQYNSDIYYTSQLPYNTSQGQFIGLNGFPLSYTMLQNGNCFTWLAQLVTSQSVNDSMFTVPSYYQQMTMQQISADIASKMK